MSQGNWAILIPLYGYLALNYLVGWYSSRFVARAPSFIQEYFLGSRDLNGFVLALTIFGTYVSAGSFIGGPGMAYAQGLGWVLLAMTQLCTGYIGLSILGKKFAILGRKLRAVTIVDFLRERYQSSAVAIIAALSIVLFLFAQMVAQWVGGARLLQVVTGMDYTVGLAIFALTVMIYVTLGGFRAATLLDAVQGTVMLAGTFLILGGVLAAGGGVSGIMSSLAAQNPELLTPFGVKGFLKIPWVTSFWVLVGIGTIGLPQLAVRAMAYRDSRAMHQAMVINTIVVGFAMLGMHLAGVFARAVIPGEKVGDLVMPKLATTVLNPWVAGVVLAAPLAAIMSTVDSVLILVASAVVKDVYLNFVRPHASEGTVKKLSLLVTSVIGTLVFVAAIKPPDFLVWLNLYALGGLEAVFLWPIVMGLYWKRANAAGALASMAVGVSTYLVFDKVWSRPFGTHTVVLPLLLGLLAMVLVSYVTRPPSEETVAKFWR